MKSLYRVAAAAALATVALAGIAVAQDHGQPPAYGTLNLSAGFQPDPQVVNVQAGGSRDAQATSSQCRGAIANAPDVRVNYRAGSYPLIISAVSNADTTLVVNGPDGRWYCDDDTNGVNPVIRFNNPGSGQYDIWIGTYSSGALQPAQLYVSEVDAAG